MPNIDASKFFSLILETVRSEDFESPRIQTLQDLCYEEGVRLCKEHGIVPVYDLVVEHSRNDPEFRSWDIFAEDLLDVVVENLLGTPFSEYYSSDEFQAYLASKAAAA